jgi:hypothetical protein
MNDPHARHDTYRTPRPRQTAADLEREIASLERAINDPDWMHGLHPERMREHYRRQLEVARRALEWEREIERAEARILQAAE